MSSARTTHNYIVGVVMRSARTTHNYTVGVMRSTKTTHQTTTDTYRNKNKEISQGKLTQKENQKKKKHVYGSTC